MLDSAKQPTGGMCKSRLVACFSFFTILSKKTMGEHMAWFLTQLLAFTYQRYAICALILSQMFIHLLNPT